MAGPVVSGLAATVAASRVAKAGTGDRRDTDMSPGWIFGLAIACLIVIGLILISFLAPTPLGSRTMALVGGRDSLRRHRRLHRSSAIYGYMAGLIGASNSPISGVGILAILTCAALLRCRRGRGSGIAERADRLRVVHHRDRLRHRDDLE